jgi:hypothetical protein
MAGEDSRIYGDDLGRFRVEAELAETTCGPGALGTPERWSFQIQLSREPHSIYWNQGGAAVEGAIANDGVSFTLASSTEVPVTLADAGGGMCSMERLDEAHGTLDSPGLDVRAFTGTLTYRFEPRLGSDCTVLVGVPGGFDALPCRVGFEIDAKRNLAPKDRY